MSNEIEDRVNGAQGHQHTRCARRGAPRRARNLLQGGAPSDSRIGGQPVEREPRRKKLAAHIHTRIWDLFLVISGQGEIRYRGDDGADTVSMPARAFCAIPPGCEHEVCNLSTTEPFSFLLIHAPWEGYDHVRGPEDAARG